YGGGLAHLSVHGRWRRLVDHHELASLDLDLPRRGPFRHLVVSEVVAIREFIALELIGSRVGVHRIEQLDALLIRHLGRTLRLRTLLPRYRPPHAPLRGSAQVAVGR